MKNFHVTAVPADYQRVAEEELQGTITDITYPVRNYINSARQLVTNRHIPFAEAGRETVEGPAIHKKCSIYLPAGYDSGDTDTCYNVLYLLHGVGGDRNEWLRGNGKAEDQYGICRLFDHLIGNGEIEPLIVVFPDGRSAHDWTDRAFNSAGTNMLGFYYFDYELRYDLIPFIESEYRTCADITDTTAEGITYSRLHRAIAGLSMGGMQTLNLVLGGYRCDAASYTGITSHWRNGLVPTVPAPGMADLFAYAGAFSNAPTSSDGKVLGSSLASSGRRIHTLYMTCGDRDEVAMPSYAGAIDRLAASAGESLGEFYQIRIKDGIHDFDVWLNGAYNFSRLAYKEQAEAHKQQIVQMNLQLGQ